MDPHYSNTAFIVQARTGSTRMPEKMMVPFVNGKSILEILLERLKDSLAEKISFIIATTVNPKDDAIEILCKQQDVICFRGSENDVMARFINAAENYEIQKIVRVCADNPLFDIAGTVDLLNESNKNEADYVGYKVAGNKPSILSHFGFWGEVVTLNALKKAYHSTNEKVYREHVTNYIYQHPDRFTVRLIDLPIGLGNREDIRLTVDTMEDFKLMQEIVAELTREKLNLNPESIIRFLDQKPEFLQRMKNQIEQNKK